MKQLLSILFALALCAAPCHAQFGALSKMYKGAKAAKQAQQKVKDIYKGISIDTTSVEYKKAMEEAQQRMYERNPQLKKMMELQGDTAAHRKYMEELYGGMSQEEIERKLLEENGINVDSKDFQETQTKVKKMSGFTEDPIFKKVMSERRPLTMEEATYLNEKYGTSFEYVGMEAYNDSIGVFAHLDGRMKPTSITKYETITDERPVPDLGQNEIKQYVQDYISFLKAPLADREIVDSVQNYMIYSNRHADEQFKGTAQFTIYSNLETNIGELTVSDMLQRKIVEFNEPIDPKNIFVFKVHKGIGCRYMEYMYSKISYKQSELSNYISKRLIAEGYMDANINQKISDDELFKAIDKMELQFKVEKLLMIRKNNEKFMYTNTIPAAKNVKMRTNIRKVGGHITALDVSIDAAPGEYAFLIRNPEVDENFKHIGDNEKNEGDRKLLQNFDISVLTKGAFFFTIK